MGPRSHERGNLLSYRLLLLSLKLLQWGRVLMNAETKRWRKYRLRRRLASMGPRSHERGNRPLDNSLRNKGLFRLLSRGRCMHALALARGPRRHGLNL